MNNVEVTLSKRTNELIQNTAFCDFHITEGSEWQHKCNSWNMLQSHISHPTESSTVLSKLIYEPRSDKKGPKDTELKHQHRLCWIMMKYVACVSCIVMSVNGIGFWHLIVQSVFRHKIHQCFLLNQNVKCITCTGRKYGSFHGYFYSCTQKYSYFFRICMRRSMLSQWSMIEGYLKFKMHWYSMSIVFVVELCAPWSRRRNEKNNKFAIMAPLNWSRMSGPHCNCIGIPTHSHWHSRFL